MPEVCDTVSDSSWVVCQIGAREHYSLARGLHAQARLNRLITDLWIQPNSPWTLVPVSSVKRLKGRFHSDLHNSGPFAANLQAIVRETGSRFRRRANESRWRNTMRRNEWFSDYSSRVLRHIAASADTPLVVFSYSYAALSVFRVARELGIRTVLGQIDAGIGHQKIVEAAYAAAPEWGSPDIPPDRYWDDWREECQLADRIIVNSRYSRNQLVTCGDVDPSRIEILPLAYEAPTRETSAREVREFDRQHPMRVLMMGRATLEKGTHILLQAAAMLQDLPIVFDLVGSARTVPSVLRQGSNLRWHGHVARDDVHEFYSRAAVLVFPTLSDGFGITQLEAQNHGVPVIASANCGDVVVNGVNGMRLQHNSAEELAEVLRQCCRKPHQLKTWSDNSCCADSFSLPRVTRQLIGAA